MPEEYVTAYAIQALDKLDGVYVETAWRDNAGYAVKIIANDKEGMVRITFEDNV
jgi:precorrin-2 methylase